MAYSVETKASSPANRLREELDQAERQIVSLNATNIEAFLLLLDQIDIHFAEFTASEADVRPEWSRWDSLTSRLSSEPDPLVNAAAKAGGLATLRQQHPPAASFWWYLDQEVRQRRMHSFRRAITTIVTVIVLALGGWWAMNTFFPPNAEAVRMMETNSALETLLGEQRWTEAMALIEKAQDELPNEPELVLWEVVLAEQLGDQAHAADAFARVNAAFPEQKVELLVQLGNQRLQVGDFLGAQAAGKEALALDPNSGQATFLLGSIAEQTNDIAVAIDMFDRTFTLAEADNPQLAVIARVRMGNLMQRGPSMQSTESITPSLTLTVTLTETATITATP